MNQKDIDEILDKLYERFRTVESLSAQLDDLSDECYDLLDDITEVTNEIEVM